MSPPYAIDIGDRSVKVAQLTPRPWWERDGSPVRLRTLLERDLEQGWVVNGVIREPERLSALLRAAAAASPRFRRSPFAVATLPENRTFLTMVPTTPEGAKTRTDAIRAAVAVLPIDPDRAVITTAAIPGPPPHTAVTACPNEVVESFAALVAAAGLTPIAFVSEAAALAHAATYTTNPQPADRNPKSETHHASRITHHSPVLILDLGATRTGAVLAFDSTAIASITIPTSGEQVTATIAQALKVDVAAAERAKRNVDLRRALPDEPIASAVLRALVPLTDGIARFRTFIMNRFPAPLQPTRVILTGGGAALGGIDEFLREHTKLDVARVRLPSDPAADRLATVFGLGLIALDPIAVLNASTV